MRSAKPEELTSYAIPVMTAAVSDAELAKWFPVDFRRITDPLETLEPSRAALVQLDAGSYVVVYYGEETKKLTLRIPPESNATAFLRDFFSEVPLPRSRVLWHSPNASMPAARAKVSALRARASRQKK